SVCESVGWRESGEVGEHDFAHAHSVDYGLEEDALVFNLCADHDEESGNDEPGAVQQHAADHGGKCEQLADACGCAAGRREAMASRKAAAKKASEIQWVCGEEVKHSEPQLHPYH